MSRFINTFPIDAAYVLIPIDGSAPTVSGLMAIAMRHLGISSTKYEVTVASDGAAYLSMKFIRDVVRVSRYLNRQRRR